LTAVADHLAVVVDLLAAAEEDHLVAEEEDNIDFIKIKKQPYLN
jgi:hypothetical protein